MTITLTLTRTLPAPPERVWRAFTEPAALAGWMWPQHTFGTTAEVDLRVGGSYLVTARRAGFSVAGEYVALDPPHRLVMTWRWDGEPVDTLVTIALTGTDTGTVLVLTHERFGDDTGRDDHAKGWSDCLDRLPAWLLAPADQ